MIPSRRLASLAARSCPPVCPLGSFSGRPTVNTLRPPRPASSCNHARRVPIPAALYLHGLSCPLVLHATANKRRQTPQTKTPTVGHPPTSTAVRPSRRPTSPPDSIASRRDGTWVCVFDASTPPPLDAKTRALPAAAQSPNDHNRNPSAQPRQTPERPPDRLQLRPLWMAARSCGRSYSLVAEDQRCNSALRPRLDRRAARRTGRTGLNASRRRHQGRC